jgi:polyether ionophore transport system permease protein
MTASTATVSGGGSGGTATMLRILWRTQRRAILVWVLVLAAGMVATAVAVAGLYDTPAKIHTYAAAVTSGSALRAINGHVEGIDSLGGVIQDEFGFLATVLLPLLGISLVVRATRQEEEAGRVELLLGGRSARHQPTLAALVTATCTVVTTAILFTAGLAVLGVPLTGSVLYAASLAGLAFVFAGLAALLAQVTLHARSVYGWALLVLAVSYCLRGVGDVTNGWVAWLSPLGWAEKAAAFGPRRWWTLALPVVVGGALAADAVVMAGRRDLGGALIRGGAGPARAPAALRTPVGFAAWAHRPTILGWLTGGLLLNAMMGALARQLIGAMTGNPALADAMGVSGVAPVDGFVAVSQLYLAVIATGYVVQAVGTLRAEEAAGRLETRLSGTLSRTRWLGARALVVLAGLLLIVTASSLALAVTTALSLGNNAETPAIMSAGMAYLPAELVLTGLALAVFGVHPRAYPFTWAAYAVVAFLALLGPGLKLSHWVLDLAPTTQVGNPPLGAVSATASAGLCAVGLGLTLFGLATFRARGIPQG